MTDLWWVQPLGLLAVLMPFWLYVEAVLEGEKLRPLGALRDLWAALIRWKP